MRQLKYHEQRLLKKVDFLQWKTDDSTREIAFLRRYHIQDREDYRKYNRLCGAITKLANRLLALDQRDPFRCKTTEQLLDKL